MTLVRSRRRFSQTPKGRLRLNSRMFFLGAAFMLLETKAVVQMALLFGSTWLVNSAGFFTVLVLILFANLYGPQDSFRPAQSALCGIARLSGGYGARAFQCVPKRGDSLAVRHPLRARSWTDVFRRCDFCPVVPR